MISNLNYIFNKTKVNVIILKSMGDIERRLDAVRGRNADLGCRRNQERMRYGCQTGGL
jgi:hypothetical protein